MALDWDTLLAHALSLPGTERSTYYGEETAKANGDPILSPGREAGSFALHIDTDAKAMLLEIDPETFWQTAHYAGWPCILVRYDSRDPERILAMIEHSYQWCLTRKAPRPRKTTR